MECLSFLKEQSRHLYQYKRLSSTKRFLENHCLWLSDPLKFNDPYEGKVRLVGCQTEMQAYRFQQDIIEPTLREYGVSCFSTKNDDVLMWGYYAEDQKGICIEFDPALDSITFDEVFPVSYMPNLPIHNIHEGVPDAINVLTKKSNVWEHEKEYRIIKKGYADRVWTVNSRAITSVILGSNCAHFYEDYDVNAKQMQEIFEILKGPEYTHIKIKQVKLDMDKYQFKIEEVPFFVCQRGNFVEIVSLKNQFVSVQSVGTPAIPYYQSEICKWERLALQLKPGKYHVLNREGKNIEFEFK